MQLTRWRGKPSEEVDQSVREWTHRVNRLGEGVNYKSNMPTRTFVSLPMVSPIVPTARPRPFNDRAWLFEPKYDGFRGMSMSPVRAAHCTQSAGTA